MRVALVIETFERGAGGVERDAVELATTFSRPAFAKIDVTVVCRRARIEAPAGVELRVLGGPSFWQPVRVREFSRRAAAATREGFDIVHSYSRTRHQQVYRAGGGSHAEFMDRFYPRARLQRMLSPRHRTILGIEEAVFRDESQIIQCLTHRDAADIQRRYGVSDERLVVTGAGVDTDRFHPSRREADGPALRRELSLAGPVALFVGSGFARKGLDRAIAGLAAADVKATLLVAGSGDPASYERQARSLGVADRVRFLGVRKDVDRLHGVADLLVLPTRYDAFGNVVLEAMASGIPPAVTPAAGASELVEHEQSGFVLEEDFAPAFAALNDPTRLQKLGQAARRTAEQWTWEQHGQRVVDLYERILA